MLFFFITGTSTGFTAYVSLYTHYVYFGSSGFGFLNARVRVRVLVRGSWVSVWKLGELCVRVACDLPTAK